MRNWFGLTSPEAHGLPGEGKCRTEPEFWQAGGDRNRCWVGKRQFHPFYLGIILVASVVFWFLNLFLQFVGNKTRLIHDRWWLFKKLRLAFRSCFSLHCGLLFVPHPMLSQPCNQNLLLFVWSDATEWILLEGSPASSNGTTCRQAQSSASWPWSSLLASNRHWMDHDGYRIGREFDQSPVYIRAYIGWWLPDFSLIQFCNRNFSCESECKASWERCTFTAEKAWRFGLLWNLSVQRLKSLWLFWRTKCYIKFWLLRF